MKKITKTKLVIILIIIITCVHVALCTALFPFSLMLAAWKWLVYRCWKYVNEKPAILTFDDFWDTTAYRLYYILPWTDNPGVVIKRFDEVQQHNKCDYLTKSSAGV